LMLVQLRVSFFIFSFSLSSNIHSDSTFIICSIIDAKNTDPSYLNEYWGHQYAESHRILFIIFKCLFLLIFVKLKANAFFTRNTSVTKSVTFLGAHSEYVVSGSDDGNIYIWYCSKLKVLWKMSVFWESTLEY
jgi:WD40 repeat protein